MSFWVYILCSDKNGTLYIGSTRDLPRRVYTHRTKKNKGFTSKYGVDKLVYAEEYSHPAEAIQRERRLKSWQRAWKIKLIEQINPEWIDLYETLHLY
jgi:putative endonuclease